MTKFKGSILELDKNKAIVMTDKCDFVSIARQPQMFVGQQVMFKKSDITKTNKNHLKYIALVASVFVIALCSIFYFQLVVPSNVYAYIDVDINPSVEFSIDKNAKVLDLKPLNNDAQTLLKNLKLVDLPLKTAIIEVVKASKQLGYISTSKENAILISASIDEDKNYKLNNPEELALNNILSDIGSVTFDVGTEKIKPDILKVTPENRKSALKNNISMGRYVLYSKLKEENNEITVEKAKTERVSVMLKKAKIKGSNKNKVNESNSIDNDSKDTNSKNKDSKEADSQDTKSKKNNSKDTVSKGIESKNNDSKDNGSIDTEPMSPTSKNNKSHETNSINFNKDEVTNNSNSSDKEGLLTENHKSDNNSLDDKKAEEDKKSNQKSEEAKVSKDTKEATNSKGNSDNNSNNNSSNDTKNDDKPVHKSK